MKENSSDSMEFNFQGGYSPKGAKTGVAEDPLESDPTAVKFKGPKRPDGYGFSSAQKSDAGTKEIPKKTSFASAFAKEDTPKPINARENIKRQKREQKAMNVVLGSAATSLFLFILVIGGLAGLGGYVLWKQIQQQSATISLMEVALRQEIIALRDDLEKADKQINKNVFRLQSTVDGQQDALKNIQNSVDAQENQNSRQNAVIRRFESRIKDLEKYKTFRR